MDERLTLLERAVRKADGSALTELVGHLARLAAPAEVEARITDLVDEADLDPAVWMPAIVEAFGVERLRRARALTFDASGKKGRDVDELQFERHGASFGLRPATASLLVIDADDREATYPSDVTPALLLRLLRDRARLDLDLEAPDVSAVPDPLEEDGRFVRECAALELKRLDGVLEAGAAPLWLVLAHEPGPVVALVRGVRLEGRAVSLTRGVHFEAGDGLPRRLYTALDLRRCCERVSHDARRTHRSRSDLDAFLGWTVRLGQHELELEVEPCEAGFGGRVWFVEPCSRNDTCVHRRGHEKHDVTVSSPLRAAAFEVLADVITARGAHKGWWRGEAGWTDTHEHTGDEDDHPRGAVAGSDEDDDEDEDDDPLDIGSARDD